MMQSCATQPLWKSQYIISPAAFLKKKKKKKTLHIRAFTKPTASPLSLCLLPMTLNQCRCSTWREEGGISMGSPEPAVGHWQYHSLPLRPFTHSYSPPSCHYWYRWFSLAAIRVIHFMDGWCELNIVPKSQRFPQTGYLSTSNAIQMWLKGLLWESVV